MTVFEFHFIAEDDGILQIGLVEAPTLAEAIREIGEYQMIDPDAIRLTNGSIPPDGETQENEHA
jgi:hypothetical protein